MAKLDGTPMTPWERLALAREAKKAKQMQTQEVETTTTEQVASAQPNVKNDDLSKVLERLEKLERENEELKAGKGNPFKKGKEKLQWPRKFSFKLWAWIPIVSIESFRKDPSKDLVFKNAAGQYVSNHYAKLSLANWENVEVEINDFGRDVTLSEQMEAKDHHGEVITLENLNMAKSYTFDTKEWGSITILSSLIN
jgi:hypothetical protein